MEKLDANESRCPARQEDILNSLQINRLWFLIFSTIQLVLDVDVFAEQQIHDENIVELVAALRIGLWK